MPTSARIIVADSGPLIALGRLDALHLLPALFSEIQVTATVMAECAARPEFVDAQRIDLAVQAGWLKPCEDHIEQPGGRLDPGEAIAIARALEIDAGLLLDDRAAVVYARALGLQVIGCLGSACSRQTARPDRALRSADRSIAGRWALPRRKRHAGGFARRWRGRGLTPTVWMCANLLKRSPHAWG